jgi:hypothetical protein
MAELSVVTLWSDFSPVHAEVIQYLRAEQFPQPTQFIWVVNASRPETHQLVCAGGVALQVRGHHLDIISSFDKPGEGLLGKHQHVARLYNMALPRIDTPLVLVVEDDNLPMVGGYAQAAATLGQHPKTGALCALYRARMNPENACAALAPDCWDRFPVYEKVPRFAFPVSFVGAGFTLYRAPAFRSGAPFHADFAGEYLHGWDANLCLQMRKHGWQILLHGGIRVEHHCREVLEWCTRNGQSIS